MEVVSKQLRSSNIELLRIVAMFMIVVHHYCVNSGLPELVDLTGSFTFNSFLAQFLSIGGKVGVNVFFIISGYFMVKSRMKWVKVFKILFEMLLYNITAFLLLTALGYRYSSSDYLHILPFVLNVAESFMASYLMLYILSPVLNKSLQALDRREYRYLLLCLLGFFSLLSTLFAQKVWSYFAWAVVMYCVGAYVRLFDVRPRRIGWARISWVLTLLIWIYIVVNDVFAIRTEHYSWLFPIFEANNFAMFLLAFTLFMTFRELRLPASPHINRLAGVTLGVFILHTNNFVMIDWLWKDFFRNTAYLQSPWFILHLLGACVTVYGVCSGVALLLKRYVETPFYARYVDNGRLQEMLLRGCKTKTK